MFPILFSAGPFTVYSFGVLLATGFFLFSFSGWRRLKDQGFNQEKIIDLFLLLAFFGLLGARLVFFLRPESRVSLSLIDLLTINRRPGLSFWGGLTAALLVLKYYCKKHRWDFWRVADELTFAFLPMTILWRVGCFLSGSPVGLPTGGFWGLFFPGDLIRRQPVSLFAAVWYLALWFFLLRVERSWRTWKWYRSSQPGVIALTFLGSAMGGGFLLAFITQNPLYYARWSQVLSLLGIASVLVIVYRRSGLNFRSGRKAKVENQKPKKDLNETN